MAASDATSQGHFGTWPTKKESYLLQEVLGNIFLVQFYLLESKVYD